jgi:hypothetical protein
MSEIERLVREQDARWLRDDSQEPRLYPGARDMEAWPPHVPRRVYDPERKWSLYELVAREGGGRR